MTTPALVNATLAAALPLVIHAPCATEPEQARRDAVLLALFEWRDALQERAQGYDPAEAERVEYALQELAWWIPCGNGEELPL